MADIIRASDGHIIGAVPTMDQETIDRERRTQEALNKKAEAWEEKQRRKTERARRALPDEGERRRGCVEGLRRFAKKADREGDPTRAAKLSQHADEAERALKEYDEGTKTLQARRPDPLGDAVQAAAKELRKALKACFPTEADATTFVRAALPLIEAKAEAARVADGYAKIARERRKADAAFWRAANAGGRVAVGTVDDDANIRRLIEAAGF